MMAEQLDMHLEALAKGIHEDYRRNCPGTPYDLPWETLPENIKDANRAQAREFPGYLDAAGCGFGAAGSAPAPVKAFTAEETDRIARQAHRVWTDSKVADGWVYGPVRDNERKIHPLLHMRWDDLAEEEKDKDREIARGMIPLLEAAGLQVFRKM